MDRKHPSFKELIAPLYDIRLHPSGRPYKPKEIAIAAGVSVSTVAAIIYDLENTEPEIGNNPTHETMNGLARAFRVHPSYFFFEFWTPQQRRQGVIAFLLENYSGL